MSDVVIAAAVRTPIGRARGCFRNLAAAQLGACVLGELLARVSLPPATIDDIVLGQTLRDPTLPNPARLAAQLAGLPPGVPAMTIDRHHASGLEALATARQSIAAGNARAILTGGQDSASLWTASDAQLESAFDEQAARLAEQLAVRHAVARSRLDEYALDSHHRAVAAADRLGEELIAVELETLSGEADSIAADEAPDSSIDRDHLQELTPSFGDSGRFTVGNRAATGDGAAAVLLVSEAQASEHRLPILARVVASARAGLDIQRAVDAPGLAARLCLDQIGWNAHELDLIECPERTALEPLILIDTLEFDPACVNVNGGALALGHAPGAGGVRELITLLHELQRRDLRRGLVTVGSGDGQAVAVVIERDTSDSLADVIEPDFAQEESPLVANRDSAARSLSA